MLNVFFNNSFVSVKLKIVLNFYFQFMLITMQRCSFLIEVRIFYFYFLYFISVISFFISVRRDLFFQYNGKLKLNAFNSDKEIDLMGI